jgi:hypothetical protein
MGMNVFQILGSMSHKIPSVEPNDQFEPGFAQIFVAGNHGTAEAQYRISKAHGKQEGAQFKLTMDICTVKRLMKLLYNINPYAKVYMHAGRSLPGGRRQNLRS